MIKTPNIDNNRERVFTVELRNLVEDICIQPGSMAAVQKTLSAWNNCPLIVKKQLDKQTEEIKDLQS